MDLLEHLLRAPAPLPIVLDLPGWFDRLDACPLATSIDRATWAGFEADRLGYAFVGGYQAALARLLEGAPLPFPLPLSRRVSLAATESGGAHPRAIETKLSTVDGALVLHGTKTFATLASAADEVLVVASDGTQADGRNSLRVVRVRKGAPGLTISDRAPTPFAPELPHSRLELAQVVVAREDVLPGDGYAVYLKPFRTIEDIHVLGATLGLLVRIARAHGWGGTFVESAVALVVALRQIAASRPTDPVTHVALAGVFDLTRRLLDGGAADWERTDPTIRERWHRDVGLLLVAETARRKRTEAAWGALANPIEPLYSDEP